ncbi:uncharacterized protein LOC130708549 isoform X1 [Balaenoptera acutorostrata]|uniref:Uncharacterized protein LOC130708549 isoform X1 n=1 Tax=Balaenoptera acutorostrata TaxID=9767 RepID=A0ABM3TTP1_BALAC|nr:uncharacterized protein LOC130708549 isoform X1 [Balaenoptera acutorostrata]
MAGSHLPGPRPRAEEAGRAEPLGCCARPGRAGGGALVDQTADRTSRLSGAPTLEELRICTAEEVPTPPFICPRTPGGGPGCPVPLQLWSMGSALMGSVQMPRVARALQGGPAASAPAGRGSTRSARPLRLQHPNLCGVSTLPASLPPSVHRAWAFSQKPDPNEGFVLVADNCRHLDPHFSCLTVVWRREFRQVPGDPVFCGFILKDPHPHPTPTPTPSMRCR